MKELIDLHPLTLVHYFSRAIKVVLPAVWSSSASVRAQPWFVAYLKPDAHGVPLDPYKVISPPPLGDDEGGEDAITEGTGAISVYQDVIFRHEADPQFRENRRRLLLQYCRIETTAMEMLRRHWDTLSAKIAHRNRPKLPHYIYKLIIY